MTSIPAAAQQAIADATSRIVCSQQSGGTLFVGGNGGSFADALHIAGELAKSFERDRPLDEALRAKLAQLSGGNDLGDQLQRGVRVVALGANPALTSAIDNDVAMRHLGLAQELCALGRPGDVLLAISTSGRSRNILNACHVARALDIDVVALTGAGPNALSELSNVAIHAAGAGTAEIQTAYVAAYHQLCREVEEGLFAH